MNSPPPAAPAPSPRLMSLDALRGFDMFWIMGGDALAAVQEVVEQQIEAHAEKAASE